MKGNISNGNQDDLATIELALRHTMHPVAPRRDFVVELQSQLYNQFGNLPALTRFSISYFIWIFLILLFSATLLFTLGIRITVLCVTAITMLQKMRRQSGAPRLD